ncbi:hypothetical protein CHS0354_026371 [Potamilus streckersoni]|uniref:Mitochondria-eating protein C-terminal domain-containing protein n=1 Tax=Potamilus streckersoni TaxID=2493646 RepID=A0AAE0W795_9BIVA|nr:hypothetical protein CHS0354_026371 [Potamilus streckersoni]
MSGSESRNGVLREDNRPGSARLAREIDLLGRNYSPATGSTDLSKVIDAIATLQTVDLIGLRRQLESTSPDNLKSLEDGQDTNINAAENVDWKMKYSDLKEQYDTLTVQLKTTEQTPSLEQKNELVLLQQRIESDDESLISLKEQLKEYKNELEKKEKRLLTQQMELEKVQKAKDEALIRLSQQMGQQMLEGNPSITDLSDQNRPSKLGEMYSELYDNEWTDAFETLTETFKLDDTKAIELLLKILLVSSKHASDVSQSAMKTIETLLSGSSEGDFLREKLTSLVGESRLRETKLKIYSEKCFYLCWLMSIQDPPVVLSEKPERGTHFDNNLYKCYINSGDNIDYVVWPALLLHKDGPLLAKGVAQPFPGANSSPSFGRITTTYKKSFDTKVREAASSSQRMDKAHTEHRNHEKLRESTSGLTRKDVTNHRYLSQNEEKVRTPTYGFNWMDITQAKYRYRNDERIRESAYGLDVTQDRYRSRNDEEARESTFDFNRTDKTRSRHQAQNNVAALTKVEHSFMAALMYSSDEGKPIVHLPTHTARTQRQASERLQLYQHQVLQNEHDKSGFERFCRNVVLLEDLRLRQLYGRDYDRYYTLYEKQTYGNSSFV